MYVRIMRRTLIACPVMIFIVSGVYTERTFITQRSKNRLSQPSFSFADEYIRNAFFFQVRNSLLLRPFRLVLDNVAQCVT